jgi:hypothetical protein
MVAMREARIAVGPSKVHSRSLTTSVEKAQLRNDQERIVIVLKTPVQSLHDTKCVQCRTFPSCFPEQTRNVELALAFGKGIMSSNVWLSHWDVMLFKKYCPR